MEFLVDGITVLLDEQDRDLAELNWYIMRRNGEPRYVWRKVAWNNPACKGMHQVVLERILGRPFQKGELTDHINQNRFDNHRQNIRLATKSLNAINTGLKRTNRSGVTGVYWEPVRNKWHAQITRNGRMRDLGRFDSLEAAIGARTDAEREHLGEFAPHE